MMRLGLVMTNKAGDEEPAVFLANHISLAIGTHGELIVTQSDATKMVCYSIVAPGLWAAANLEPYVEEGE